MPQKRTCGVLPTLAATTSSVSYAFAGNDKSRGCSAANAVATVCALILEVLLWPILGLALLLGPIVIVEECGSIRAIRQWCELVRRHLGRVFLYEEWTDRSAFEGYRTSDYFDRGGAILHPAMADAPDSAYYESERVGP